MKTIQFISMAAMAAAAGLMVGCSSNEYTQTPVPPNGTSVDMSRNTSGTAGNSAYNFNQGAYVPQAQLTIDQLPQPAQNTIRDQIGGQPIAKIKQETRDGQTAYRVELQRRDWHSERPSLLVAADGSILKERHMGEINEAAGAEAPAPYRPNSGLGATGVQPDPGTPSNPASPTPAFPPSSVMSDR